MKKFAIVMLALGLMLIGFAPIANASDEESILIYSHDNTSGAVENTNISTSTIIPGKHRLLGFAITPQVSGAGTVNAGVWDSASTAARVETDMFGELACANTTTAERVFPKPADIDSGVSYSLGAAASITIYYERSRP